MSEEHPVPPLLPGNGTRLLLRLTWPIMLLLIVILTVSIGLVALPIVLAPHSELAQITSTVAEGHSIARLAALIIIVPAICVLSLLDKVNGSAAIAALSAIAGYVLGGTAPK
jgi:hypothetical protein